MGSAERLAMLARDALAAGVPAGADGLAAWITARTPDLANEARALADLMARGLAVPLAQGAYPAHEDVPIANDLSTRLGMPLTAAQTAVAAARAGGGVTAPYQPSVGGQAGSLPPTGKPLHKKWWFWVLVALAVGAAAMAYNWQQYRSNMVAALGRNAAIPVLQAREDATTGQVGVRFRFGDHWKSKQPLIIGWLLWPKGGLRAGEGELIVGRPGDLKPDRQNPGFLIKGPIEMSMKDGRPVAVVTPRSQNITAGNGIPPLSVMIVGRPGTTVDYLAKPKGGELICVAVAEGNAPDPREGCGELPAMPAY